MMMMKDSPPISAANFDRLNFANFAHFRCEIGEIGK